MPKQALPLIVLAMIVALAACSGRTDSDKIWEGGGNAWSDGEQPAIAFTAIDGYFGDVEIHFTLTPADGGKRSVVLQYNGACVGDQWVRAHVGGEVNALAPGGHTIVWHSWEQEAGCAGDVQLRLATGQGETADSASFALDNTHEGATGFLEMPLVDQGIQSNEEEAYENALAVLVDNEYVDFVATRIDDVYEVHAARGSVYFRREQTNNGYEYIIDAVEGTNPIERQDPYYLPTLEEEFAVGSNPNNATIPKQGYKTGDVRLSFIEPEDDSYPFGYQRIAAYFDNPNSADFMINWRGYAHNYDGPHGDLGTHGSLNIFQSRCPLVMWGRGIRPGVLTGAYRQVDLAPTVARLLGISTRYGVDERGIYTNGVYLGWQDGHVITDALDGGTSSTVMILVLDGMAHNGLLNQVMTRADELPNLYRLFSEGAWAEYGSTTNWPSVTFPSHNVIGSGMYSGHHGLVDNSFYYRDEVDYASPIDENLFTEKYFQPIGPGQSLHQRVSEEWGQYSALWHRGAVTASIFDPSVAGATKADLEFRDLTRQSPFPPLGVEWPREIPWPDVLVGNTNTYFEQWAQLVGMVELFHLFDNGVSPNPSYVIMNYIATDGCGHANGPFGDDMKRTLKHVDDNLGVLFEWLERWGIADDFTLILTSDHGMQLGDPTRSGWPLYALDDAGIGYVADTCLGVYLQIFDAQFTPETLMLNSEQLVYVNLADVDNHRPIVGATVLADDGVTFREAVTDDFGNARFGIAPVGPVHVTITHPEYTDQEYQLAAQ